MLPLRDDIGKPRTLSHSAPSLQILIDDDLLSRLCPNVRERKVEKSEELKN